MSDPRTFLIDTETDLECESCSWTNTDVTVWDDIRDGTWSYEFECTSCGHLNKASGSSLDRGTLAVAQALFFLLIVGGVLIVIGGISLLGGHTQWWPLFAGGLWLVVVTLLIALVKGGTRQDNDS